MNTELLRNLYRRGIDVPRGVDVTRDPPTVTKTSKSVWRDKKRTEQCRICPCYLRIGETNFCGWGRDAKVLTPTKYLINCSLLSETRMKQYRQSRTRSLDYLRGLRQLHWNGEVLEEPPSLQERIDNF